MIIIFSKNNYLEQALRNFKIYQNLKIKTTQDENQLKGRDRICILDEMGVFNNQCQISITLSKVGTPDLKKPFHISSLNILIIKCLTRLNNYIFLNKFSFLYNERLLINNDDKVIKLTEKEASLLNFILKSPNFTIDKNEALDKLWQYNIDSETSTLETHIYLLKAKFKKLGFEDALSIQKDKMNFNI
jgi:hypothetical protein